MPFKDTTRYHQIPLALDDQEKIAFVTPVGNYHYKVMPFGVGSGNFLGYMVTHRGIKVNPDQIKAINKLQPPRNLKAVQKLTGMTTALNRFISRSVDRCRPFFLLLHK